MNRIKVLSGTCVALLGALSAAELYYDRPMPVPPVKKQIIQAPKELQPVNADEVVSAYLAGLKEGPEIDRAVAVASLMDRLESAEFAKSPLGAEASDAFVTAAELVINETQSEEPESVLLKSRLAGFIAGRTRGGRAQEFVLKALQDGPEPLREAVVLRVGSPTGVGGRTVYAKLVELQTQIPGERLPQALRRTGGKKSVETIVALMKSTDNAKVISACVVALQDFRDPALLGQALERLEQTGALEQPSKLPWIGAELLMSHLETAEGTPLKRGVTAMRTRPSLAKKGAAALERAFQLGDAQTKQIASEAVRKALVAGVLSPEQGEKLLAGNSHPETPAVIKAALPSNEEVKAQ